MFRLNGHGRSGGVRRLGALCGLSAVLLVVLPVGSASAAVVDAVGLSGTVLGWSSWYGSYTVTGVGTGFCLDHAKLAPDSTYNYKLAATIGGTTGAELAYVARTYGATRDAVTGAATNLVIHDLQNAVYPYGALNVMTLQPSQIAGLNGEGAKVISRARAIMSDTLAHYLTGPYHLSLVTPTSVSATRTVPVSLSLLDGRGTAIVGARVTLTATNTTVKALTVTTDSTGKAKAVFTATGTNVSVAVTASTVLPSPTPLVYAASGTYAAKAQRIIIAGSTPLTQTRVTTVRTVAQQPATTVTITVVKTGDATAYYPVDGATFELHADTPSGARVAGPVTISGGRATFPPTVTDNLSVLWLVETAAPSGYAVADPVSVPLAGSSTVDVTDAALRGSLNLVKLDAQTQQPVAGAVLDVRYDANNDGSYETDLGTFRSDIAPVTVADLLPGRYQVTEVTAPAGYELPAQATDAVTVSPGGTLTVTFSDNSLTTVTFAKQAAGTYDPNHYSLAGATFVVSDGASPPTEAGRCTTDATGRCTLPEQSLVTGQRYCWTEATAPAGFAASQGGCFNATARAQITVVDVAEQGVYATITVTKHDATDPTRMLAGATYALLAGDGTGAPLATTTTGADGTGTFPPVLPGVAYCVRELTAPPGYQLDPTAHCTDGPVTTSASITIPLADRLAPPPPVIKAPPVAKPPVVKAPPAVTAPVPVPSVHKPRPVLPHTGIAAVRLAQLAAAAVLGGAVLLLFGAPRRPRSALWPVSHLD
jgi:hypothetical protein